MDGYFRICCSRHEILYTEKSPHEYVVRFGIGELGRFQRCVGALRSFYGSGICFGGAVLYTDGSGAEVEVRIGCVDAG